MSFFSSRPMRFYWNLLEVVQRLSGICPFEYCSQWIWIGIVPPPIKVEFDEDFPKWNDKIINEWVELNRIYSKVKNIICCCLQLRSAVLWKRTYFERTHFVENRIMSFRFVSYSMNSEWVYDEKSWRQEIVWEIETYLHNLVTPSHGIKVYVTWES